MTNSISSNMSVRYRVDEHGVGLCDGTEPEPQIDAETETQTQPAQDCRVRVIRAATECAAGGAAILLSAATGGAGVLLAAIAGVKCGLEIEAAVSCIKGE